MTQLDELELDKGEDAPMSMAAIPDTKTIVCGINSGENSLKDGLNQNCRKFTVADDKYVSIISFRKCATNHSYLLCCSGSPFKLAQARSSWTLLVMIIRSVPMSETFSKLG